MLLNIVDHLPRNSAYGEACALDEALVDPDAPPERRRPSMREWSPEVELLAAIFDRLNNVVQVQSSKDLRLKPWPSPVTAADMLRERERRNRRARLTRLIANAKRRYREGG